MSSQELSTINTPFGKYKYLWILMGLKCYPDIAKAIMENVLSDIEEADIYVYDFGAFSNDWNHHVNLLSTILLCLCKNGFTINPLKCKWAIKETLTSLVIGLHHDIKSLGKRKLMPSSIWFILAMPQNLHVFISCMNYYHDNG
jgi:hypothetical protein